MTGVVLPGPRVYLRTREMEQAMKALGWEGAEVRYDALGPFLRCDDLNELRHRMMVYRGPWRQGMAEVRCALLGRLVEAR